MSPKIFTHKTEAMRSLLNNVSRGYFFYTLGTVSIKKFEGLTYKFEDRYHINMNAQQRYRAKAKGQPNVKMIAWKNFEGSISFWLLSTDGDKDAPIFVAEDMKDVRHKQTRLSLEGYELVKMPRKNAKAAWTWRITKENMESWEARIKKVVRSKHDDGIRQAVYSLQRIAGFAGSRRQGFTLVALMKNEWKRNMKTEWPHKGIFIGWVGKYKEKNI